MERLLEYLDFEQLWLALDLILAALLGFFIGLERKLRDKMVQDRYKLLNQNNG